MSYKHGVYTSEVATALVPMVESLSGLPVVIGTAPVHLGDINNVNKPILCYTYKEAVKALGYNKDWETYTLCEFMKSHFTLFNVAPVVFINILDSKKHKKEEIDKVITLESGEGLIVDDVLLHTLIIKDTTDESLTVGEDYTAEFNDDGCVIISVLKSGITESVKASYTKIDATTISSSDIIGGVNSEGKSTGLELINDVLPKFGLVPGQILAPGWSHIPEVAAVMVAKSSNINGLFKCSTLTDIPIDECENYTEVVSWKNSNNYTYNNQFNCWPKARLGDDIYHLSTQMASLICLTDSRFDGVPYVSPSNKNLQINGLVGKNGEEIVLGIDQANYLNGQGIVTAINFSGGWKLWGNRTGVYPSNTDPKDSFIPVRRMFDWIATTIVQTFWNKVDGPITTRLVDNILDSINIWFNGLSASGYILGGRVVWLEDDNPVTSIMDGKMKFHVYVTPPSPGRELDFELEYDIEYLKSLFV